MRLVYGAKNLIFGTCENLRTSRARTLSIDAASLLKPGTCDSVQSLAVRVKSNPQVNKR